MSMKYLGLLPMMALLALAVPAAAEAPPTPAQTAEIAKITALAKSLHPMHGDVKIKGADATLHLGEDYYYLASDEAKRVLVDAWGNPPEVATNVLGMVFPAGKSFADADSWGAVITSNSTGYVADTEADTFDYNKYVKDIQDGEEDENAERKKAGFGTSHLVGWAQSPTYDKIGHSMIWARNIQFGGQSVNTLNYDVRLLGRRGVLSLNMVATMPQLAQIKTDAAALARAVTFDPGARYADYKAGTDKKAEYGVAGLVAAGLGVVAAKKLGILAIALGFGKKIIVLVVAAGIALRKWFAKLFGAKPEE